MRRTCRFFEVKQAVTAVVARSRKPDDLVDWSPFHIQLANAGDELHTALVNFSQPAAWQPRLLKALVRIYPGTTHAQWRNTIVQGVPACAPPVGVPAAVDIVAHAHALLSLPKDTDPDVLVVHALQLRCKVNAMLMSSGQAVSRKLFMKPAPTASNRAAFLSCCKQGLWNFLQSYTRMREAQDGLTHWPADIAAVVSGKRDDLDRAAVFSAYFAPESPVYELAAQSAPRAVTSFLIDGVSSVLRHSPAALAPAPSGAAAAKRPRRPVSHAAYARKDDGGAKVDAANRTAQQQQAFANSKHGTYKLDPDVMPAHKVTVHYVTAVDKANKPLDYKVLTHVSTADAGGSVTRWIAADPGMFVSMLLLWPCALHTPALFVFVRAGLKYSLVTTPLAAHGADSGSSFVAFPRKEFHDARQPRLKARPPAVQAALQILSQLSLKQPDFVATATKFLFHLGAAEEAQTCVRSYYSSVAARRARLAHHGRRKACLQALVRRIQGSDRTVSTVLCCGDGFSRRDASGGSLASNVPGVIQHTSATLRTAAVHEFKTSLSCCACHAGIMVYDAASRMGECTNCRQYIDRDCNGECVTACGLPAARARVNACIVVHLAAQLRATCCAALLPATKTSRARLTCHGNGLRLLVTARRTTTRTAPARHQSQKRTVTGMTCLLMCWQQEQPGCVRVLVCRHPQPVLR